ncbi:ORF6N domain-containing protein [Flavobacterium sp.]|uniref:ORF6N domain-containing protein n=1 Tax=Flavobacterium sp. TaxID=239 RepID=UPI0011FF978C|nr:ORF6N domain-containing protein [Flavobacterium sp.]RZJ73859.1 MAG: ORF6N domain-containing protein [Flavobacterium sp.]
MSKPSDIQAPEDLLLIKIQIIRNQKVMLDRDLAMLYGVETKRLKEAVRRNIDRFPEDFMFELTKEELENWRTQIASSNSVLMGLRYAPMAFTEHGILMLSSVLNSEKAVQTNIRIMRLFSKMRKFASEASELRSDVEQIRKKVDVQTQNIELIFQYIDELSAKDEPPDRKRIGYKN